MGERLVSLCIVTAVVLTIFPCCTSSESPDQGFVHNARLQLSLEDFYENPEYCKSLQLAVDGLLSIILSSNATTGYKWSDPAQITDKNVLEQVSHKYVAPTSLNVGAAGYEVWTFKTLEKGTSSLYLEYRKPWQAGEKPIYTLSLNVIVG